MNTEQGERSGATGKHIQRVILERYQANLPESVGKLKDCDLDQAKQAMAENEAMQKAVTVAIFVLSNKIDQLTEQFNSLTESINRISKAVEEMPDLIHNTMLTAVSKPAGGGKAN